MYLQGIIWRKHKPCIGDTQHDWERLSFYVMIVNLTESLKPSGNIIHHPIPRPNKNIDVGIAHPYVIITH